MRTRSTPRAVAVRLAASGPGRPVLLSRFSLTVTPSRLDEVWHAARLVRTHPSRRRSPRRPPSLSRNRLTGRHIRTKTLTTTTPRERPTSHGKCTHHLTLTPALLPAPSILLPLTDGDIPRSRVHAAPEGDILRVRGQDSGPRRRRTPPTAQKCPRRRRTSPLGASGPMGRRYPPALRRLPPHHRAQPPRAPAQATGLTSPHSLFGGLQPPTRTIFFTTLPDDAPPRSSHSAAAPRQHAGHLPPLEKSSIAT